MLKKYLLIIIFILVGISTNAQRFFIEPSVGIAFPVADYAGKNMDRHGMRKNGLALPGLATNIVAGYKLSKSFAVVSLIGFQQNAMDERPVKEVLTKTFDSIVVSAGSYKIGKWLAGLSLSTPIGFIKNLSVETKIFTGACKVVSPNDQYFAASYANPGRRGGIIWTEKSIGKEQKPPIAVAYQVDATLRYKIGKRINIIATGSFFAAAPIYQNSRQVIFNKDDPQYLDDNSRNHPVNSIIASAGISYTIGADKLLQKR